MILLEISDIKAAMVHLLLRDSFDTFYLESAELHTFVPLTLRGRRNMAWYDSDEISDPGTMTEWVRWSEVRPLVFSYIKGDKTPTTMKVTLKTDVDRAGFLFAHSGLAGLDQQQCPELVLNFRYELDRLSVVTGVSYTEFTMDKQIEFAWDEAVNHYFRQLGIALF